MREVTKTYLYRMFDSDGKLLYVGISKSVLKRLGEHLNEKDWLPDEACIKWTTYQTREKAEAAERRAIQNESPIWNIVHAAASAYVEELPPEELANACIRDQGKVKHYRRCKMRPGGYQPCRWEDLVIRTGFCCLQGFSKTVRNYPSGYYRRVMDSYLDAYMRAHDGQDAVAIPLSGQYPEFVNLDCGAH